MNHANQSATKALRLSLALFQALGDPSPPTLQREVQAAKAQGFTNFLSIQLPTSVHVNRRKPHLGKVAFVSHGTAACVLVVR
jgi:hypothetical protein